MSKRIVISGGGTGGHVFPAISIANALKRIDNSLNIHFVGALGKLEMKKVPEAGYEITGLPVEGFIRKVSVRNITVIIKLLKSLRMAKKIISSFKPDVVVGVGGYASGPILKVAGRNGIPTLIQEQNSTPGVTNKLLAKKAKKICVAYQDMEKYFPAEKILLTGNPVRKDLISPDNKRKEAIGYFRLDESLPVILMLGGSGGSRTINKSVVAGLSKIEKNKVQVIWQTGKNYFEDMQISCRRSGSLMIRLHDFISRMDLAYAAADIVVSRAGAVTISELSISGKPVVLIPSPNVAEDHQTKNAMALVNKDAALMLRDDESEKKLADLIIELAHNEEKCRSLSKNISSMAIEDSDMIIAKEILKLSE
ncbi:MAG TPA: undecaprenyldiphospho-muramoylpentapeptide beta-N-acetylglucosaminyltransferase [Bacteroidales bacterium]|nr:undecaprenyldiphospho-muramoylpentapeptide beta-N-acetylglucosaminyltransferase [Bacteroidales bacterium]